MQVIKEQLKAQMQYQLVSAMATADPIQHSMISGENVFSYYRMCSLTIECVLLLTSSTR